MSETQANPSREDPSVCNNIPLSPTTTRQDRKPDPPDSVQDCRICLMQDTAAKLVEPCYCLGSVRYAHLDCLKAWAAQRADLHCEICKAKYTDIVLPYLEPEVKKVVEERQAARAAALLAARTQTRLPLPPPTTDDDEGEQSYLGSRKFWTRAAFLLGVLGVIIGLLLFLGLYAGDDAWAAILLRVLAFVLPLLIVLRAVMACLELRRLEREERGEAAASAAAPSGGNNSSDGSSGLYQRQAQNALSSPV